MPCISMTLEESNSVIIMMLLKLALFELTKNFHYNLLVDTYLA